MLTTALDPRPESVLPWTWIVRLRGAGLLLVLLGTITGGIPPLPAVGALIVGGALNALLLGEGRRRALGWVLGADVLLLGALLAASGDVSSPYTLLFALPVVLAGLTLAPGPAWGVFVTGLLVYGALFRLDPPVLHHHGPEQMREHLLGMFAAWALTSGLLLVAAERLRDAEARLQRAIAAERDRAQRQGRLNALATLAAGAAHELATPLSTILLVSGELRRRASDPRDLEDLDLLREEVGRCREVLAQLSADAGDGLGELPSALPVAAFVREALYGIERLQPVEIDVPPSFTVHAPRQLLAAALRRVVGNARTAAGAGSPIAITAEDLGDRVVLRVTDRGPGMSADVLARAGEPFFTTKPPGEGRGLGLYFARSIAERAGGALRITSRPGAGTIVAFELPKEAP